MKRLLLAAGACSMLLAACGGGSPSTGATAGTTAAAGGGSTGGNSVTITISNFKFVPANVTVKPGETIKIVNKDNLAHTFTALPTDSAKFDTGDINQGQSASVTAPSTAGAYNYHCSIHPFMTGTVTVSG